MSSTLIGFLNGWLAELKRDKKRIRGAIMKNAYKSTWSAAVEVRGDVRDYGIHLPAKRQ